MRIKKNSQFFKDKKIIWEWFKPDCVLTTVFDQSISGAIIVLSEVKTYTDL